MDFPGFRGTELVQDRRSCPNGTLSEFLENGRFRMPPPRLWKPPVTSARAFCILLLIESLIWATTSVGSVGT